MMKFDELHKLQGVIDNLPAFAPRPGLKQELLEKILAEVRREPISKPKRSGKWKRPAVGFSLSLAGLALSIVLLVYLMPMNATKPDNTTGALSLGAGVVDAVKSTDREIAMLKAERAKAIMRQVIPRANGEYVGEGIEVTLSTKDPKMAHREYLVDNVESDFDLLRLVQEIYNNGGQLVAINDILVMPYSQIVSHGTLTEVSDRRIQAPFVIKVIGDRDALYEKLHGQDSALVHLQEEKGLTVSVDAYEFVTIDPIK